MLPTDVGKRSRTGRLSWAMSLFSCLQSVRVAENVGNGCQSYAEPNDWLAYGFDSQKQKSFHELLPSNHYDSMTPRIAATVDTDADQEGLSPTSDKRPLTYDTGTRHSVNEDDAMVTTKKNTSGCNENGNSHNNKALLDRFQYVVG
eukprot:6485775-Amphidinium_carterae.2